jgi:UrcA family protein
MFRNKPNVAVRSALALLLAAGSFALVVPAYAANPPDPSMTVRFADLNLTNDEGVRALFQRIQHAARVVCDEAIPPNDVLHISHWSSCYNGAVANAIGQVNSAKLTAMYAQAGHRRAG